MDINSYCGKLIAIDGPNGVGKSTIINELKLRMNILGLDVYFTKEPTESELGIFTRNIAEKQSGLTVACLVAANRYEHIENEIIPNLKSGKIVISDRYILSSLILQRMDGVSEKFIININDKIVLPDLQIAVTADKDIIHSRLLKRAYLTRFEMNNQTEVELKYLHRGIELLKHKEVNVLQVNNNDMLDETVNSIIENVVGLVEVK